MNPDTVGDETVVNDAGEPGGEVEEVDRANMARVYNYWCGGKDNYLRDREVGDAVARSSPLVVAGARANREFLGRAVTYLARAGITQFLDVGAGLPSAGNVHEVAQRVNPDARTIYVDNDDVVIAHARALLACDAQTIVVKADAREPENLLNDPSVRGHLDFSRPVAILFVAILHFLPDDPGAIVKTFRDQLAPGSAIVISHVADLETPPTPGGTPSGGDAEADAAEVREAVALYRRIGAPFALRTRPEIEALFDGLEFIAPGLVPAALWRATPSARAVVAPILAGIGRVNDTTREAVGGDRATNA